jgi:hypothetical protein
LPPQLKAFEDGISGDIGIGERQIGMPFYLQYRFLISIKQ